MEPDLTVGVDLDGVVVDIVSAMLPKLTELRGRLTTAEDITVFDIGVALSLPQEAMDDLWQWLEIERVYSRAPAVVGCQNSIRIWAAPSTPCQI